MRSYAVFQFTQRAIENRFAWHACRRLPTPVIRYKLVFVSKVKSIYLHGTDKIVVKWLVAPNAHK
jgi:hypothetical protein